MTKIWSEISAISAGSCNAGERSLARCVAVERQPEAAAAAAGGFGRCCALWRRPWPGRRRALFGAALIGFGGFGGVNRLVVLVGFGQFVFSPQQAAEAVGGAELKLVVHADGVEGADLDADLAAHADGDVDVEDGGIELHLADEVGLLVLALFDVDALRRAFFFADLAGDAAQAGFGVGAVVEQEREIGALPRRAWCVPRDTGRW